MIKVTVGNTTQRKDVIVDETTLVKDVFYNNGYPNINGIVHLNGVALRDVELNKSLGALGVTDSCTLISVIKLDNA